MEEPIPFRKRSNLDQKTSILADELKKALSSLTQAQADVLDVTLPFVEILHENGMPIGEIVSWGYKFCEAALREDISTCTRMQEAAGLIGIATWLAGINPHQERGE